MKQIISATPPEPDTTRIVERRDGFYWRSRGGGREYGPFATLLEAEQDRRGDGDEAPEPGETLEQVQADIGVANWIDPDTGEPAEEERPRIEEH
jgi:hypothetical protein